MKDGRWLLLPSDRWSNTDFTCLWDRPLLRGTRLSRRCRAGERPRGAGFPYGICRTMRNFSGTVSLSPETFAPLVREILAEYARHGAKKMVLLAGHAEDARKERCAKPPCTW